MNPEFERNLWLELTPHRLVAAPLVLGAVFTLIYLTVEEDPLFSIATGAIWAVIIVGGFWGTRMAAESVTTEVAAATWDFQRLSSLRPWSVTWGKLFGATSFSWYTCLMAMAVMVVTAQPVHSLAGGTLLALALALNLILAHAIGLFMSLLIAQREGVVSRRAGFGFQAAGLLIAAPFVVYTLADFYGEQADPVYWYRWTVNGIEFSRYALLAFAAWAVIGCHRLMRTELKMRNGPGVWVAFVLFCMVFVAGFARNAGGQPARRLGIDSLSGLEIELVTAFIVALTLAYVALIIEHKDPIAYRRLLHRLSRLEFRRVVDDLPRFAIAFVIAALVVPGFVWLSLQSVQADLGATPSVALSLSALAFFARDAGLAIALNLSAGRSRADIATVFYLAILYVLLPSLLSGLSLDVPAGWFYPLHDGGLLYVLPPLIQAAATWWLARVRWSKLWRAGALPPRAA